MGLSDEVAAVFAPDGPLARALPGYEVRDGQVLLAEGMADAIELGEPLLGEAGTGIGKSLAYLVAVLAAGKRAVISTHTKALQGQLADKDMPVVRQVFPGVTAAVLKGRSNYLCLLEYHKLTREVGDAGGQGVLFDSRAEASAYQTLRAWLRSAEGQAADGDLDRAPFGLPEELRAAVTVDGQSCVGRKCPYFGDCYSQRAKAEAEAARLVIVNHRILLLDLVLGDTTGGEVTLLPDIGVVILDEAHHLEDVATDSFGAELSAGRWASLERRLRRLGDELRQRWEGEEAKAIALETLDRIVDLGPTLTTQAEAWMDRLLGALAEAKARELRLLLNPALSTEGAALSDATMRLVLGAWEIADRLKAAMSEAEAHEAERWVKLGESAHRLRDWLELALNPQPEENPPLVRYVEREAGRRGERAVVCLRTVRVAELLARLLWSRRQVLAVSATLATGAAPGNGEGAGATLAQQGRLWPSRSDPFTYWRERVGVEGGVTRVIPSPFPFRERVRLYVPADAAAFDPSRPEVKTPAGLEAYRARVVARIEALLRMRSGGGFALFTSAAMLRYTAERLRDLDGLVLVQGEAPPAELVRRFKADGRGILLGTRTFWEGVDVPGDALSMVVIDRLPFAVPDDPLWEARVREAGEDWFRALALPASLMSLKQAFGRLMRRMDDWGVVAVLDTRLRTKAYGRYLLGGLPPARLVGELAEVEAFCAAGMRR
jgi:ATP-dependent DNA helicase DinG